MPSEVIALMSAIKSGEEIIHDDVRICKFSQKVTGFQLYAYSVLTIHLSEVRNHFGFMLNVAQMMIGDNF